MTDKTSEIDVWLVTIDAHCAVLLDPGPTDTAEELIGCIMDCVAEIRGILNKDDPRAAYRHLEVKARTGFTLTPSQDAMQEIARREAISQDWNSEQSTYPWRGR